jgi:SNF2 family DNA or RNA helicase
MVLSDLPGKTNHILWCEMAPEQRTLYESILEDAKGTDNDGMMMTVMMQLRKCANHPLLMRVYVSLLLNK